MQKKQLFSFLSAMVVVAFMFSLFGTINVLADDGDTPPVPTKETVQPPTEETAPETEADPTSTPEADVAAEAATSTPEVDSTDTPEVDTPTEEPTETPAEILESAPEGMDVVVLDENGDALALVTEEAAQVIVNGDPMWCPDGVQPGGAGCTPAYTDFASLIADLTDGGYAGSGTIYVAYDYVDAEGDIVIDHGSGSLSGLDNLVIQGGWNFGTNAVVGSSNLGDNSLSITNWVGNVTVNNIFISGAGQTGLTVDTDGQIEINNVTSNNNDGHGAQLTSDGAIKVSNSQFNNNDQDVDSGAESLTPIFNGSGPLPLIGGRGLVSGSSGNITLNNVTANGNGAGGAELVNCFFDIDTIDCLNPGPANIFVNNSTFNENGTDSGQPVVGLWVGAHDTAGLNNVTANGNATDSFAGGGALVFSGYGGTTIENSQFNENCAGCLLGFGLISLNVEGGSTLKNVQANSNADGSEFGIGIVSASVFGDTLFENVQANGNANGGVFGAGAIALTLEGNLYIKNSQFNGNCPDCDEIGVGLAAINLDGDYTLIKNVQANGNGLGAAVMSYGDVDIICSTFNNNTFYGLLALSNGTLTLSGVATDGNGLGDMDGFAPTVIVNAGDCNTAKEAKDSLPVNVIPTEEGQHELDCQSYSATVLLLPNDDHVRFPCPLRDAAGINAVTSDTLPATLPENNTFRDGVNVQLFNQGIEQSNASPFITVSFLIPEGVDVEGLSILVWNGSEWVDLGGAVSSVGPHDEVVEGVLYFKVTTSYVGTFVLVSK